jgi:hypothetical protein
VAACSDKRRATPRRENIIEQPGVTLEWPAGLTFFANALGLTITAFVPFWKGNWKDF